MPLDSTYDRSMQPKVSPDGRTGGWVWGGWRLASRRHLIAMTSGRADRQLMTSFRCGGETGKQGNRAGRRTQVWLEEERGGHLLGTAAAPAPIDAVAGRPHTYVDGGWAGMVMVSVFSPSPVCFQLGVAPSRIVFRWSSLQRVPGNRRRLYTFS
jgi:hypothetical protein